MSAQSRYPYEGLLYKYTNAVKGWQYRWFNLSPETGELHYFLSESEKLNKPRCSIYLAGAMIAPSDEDSNTFIVNSATGDCIILNQLKNTLTSDFIIRGEMIKLRATDARARQEWVDKLRAIAEMYTRAIASSHPPLPPREHSGSLRTSVAKLENLDAFANCRELLDKAEKQSQVLAQVIENSDMNLNPHLLLLKATAHATVFTLNQCLNILYQ